MPHTFRESTKTNDKSEAKAQLQEHKKNLVNDTPMAARREQPTFSDMAARLRRDYEVNSRDVVTLNFRLVHLEGAFGIRRMIDITRDDIESYKDQRRKVGAANGTINREIAALSRCYSLGLELQLLNTTPPMRKLKLAESPARAGFFESDGYAKVTAKLPSDALRLACQIMHTYGWRKSEVMTLERRHVDMAFGTLRLDAGSTKNDDARVVPLTPALRASLAAQLASLDAWQDRTGRRTPWLFTHTEGRHEGKPITDFVRSWRAACLAAELEGLTGEARLQRKAELQEHPEGLALALRHDFRRTAVRNMLNTGTDESTAMKITGHRTASIFKRYRIVNLADMQRAVERLPQAGNGSNHLLGHVAERDGKVTSQE